MSNLSICLFSEALAELALSSDKLTSVEKSPESKQAIDKDARARIVAAVKELSVMDTKMGLFNFTNKVKKVKMNM